MTDPTKSMGCSRRSFLPMLLREIVVTANSAQGTPGHQLNELGDLPDDALAMICPMINPIYQIRVIEGYVCSQLKDKEDATVRAHFPTSPENLAVFNRFNGRHTIGEIAEAITIDLEWEPERAFAYTHTLFLDLASHLVAVPKNSPELEAERIAQKESHEPD